jgi:penicillin-binding protein activator
MNAPARLSPLHRCGFGLVACLAFVAPLAGCRSSFEGSYSDPNKVEIVDDRWNDTDARLVGEKMIKSALSKQWLANYTAENKGQKPFILVDDFENRTSEQIDTKAIFESVRNELINSGRIRFLDGAQRKKILDEYRYQNSGTTRKDQAKKAGKQYGADFFLVGAISSIVSQQSGYKTVTYQVEMRLTHIETSEIVFTEVEKVKKAFRRSGVGG